MVKILMWKWLAITFIIVLYVIGFMTFSAALMSIPEFYGQSVLAFVILFDGFIILLCCGGILKLIKSIKKRSVAMNIKEES